MSRKCLPTLRDTEARNALVLQWKGLPGYVAKWLRVKHLTFDEAEAAGCDGLIRAAETFEESRGVKFSTYAIHWIK